MEQRDLTAEQPTVIREQTDKFLFLKNAQYASFISLYRCGVLFLTNTLRLVTYLIDVPDAINIFSIELRIVVVCSDMPPSISLFAPVLGSGNAAIVPEI